MTSADDALPLQGRQVAGLRLAAGAEAVAHIDSPTRVQFFVGQGDKWKPHAVTIDSPQLVPGAPLTLVAVEGEELPQVLTIGASGRLLEVTPRKTGIDVAPVAVALVPPNIELPPGGGFTVARRSKRSNVFAIDGDGTMWEFDRQAGTPTKIESRAGLLLPGGAIQSYRDEGDELFLVDRRGNLVSYLRDPIVRWKGPRLIGTGFVAGSDLIVWRRPDNKRDMQLAAVNARGELQVGRLEPNGWKLEIAPGWVLSPGTPVGVAHTPVNMRLCGVTGRGTLQEMHLLNTEWRERTIASGLAWKSDAVFLANGPVAMAIDIAGNLLSATHNEEVWSTFITTPDPAGETVRLVGREWKRSSEGLPVDLELVNSASVELVVRIRDRRHPAEIVERTIAPAASTKFELQADVEGELFDIRRYAAADGTKTEQTKSTATRPQSLYEVEVLELRESLIPYIDLRQNPWPRIPRGQTGPVSLGTFAIPVETAASTGMRVNLIESATARQLIPVAE